MDVKTRWTTSRSRRYCSERGKLSVREFLGARADRKRADFEIEREDAKEAEEDKEAEEEEEDKKSRKKGSSATAKKRKIQRL